MFHSFKVLWDHRKMLWATTLADIQSRYAGSVLGMFWLVIYPILMLTAYSVVYVFIFQVRLEQITTPQYVMLIFFRLDPVSGLQREVGELCDLRYIQCLPGEKHALSHRAHPGKSSSL